MKLFLDTAQIEEIKKYAACGLVDGVTTNPTLIMKSGRNQEEVTKEICSIVQGPVSAEVIAQDAKGMVSEGKKFAKWAPNVVVKIPMTEEGMKAVKELEQGGIRTNVTLVFSASQALLAAKAGASFVSPFIGRLDDVSGTGMKLVSDIVQIYSNYGFETEVIVASVRSAQHVNDAALVGAHIATVPAKIFAQLFSHPLTDKGIKMFLDDYEKAKASKK
ncbi:fructose-6-phosphate aldolase [Candidatus Micrarchaeota archaeon CG10_big_fil_rev_8_21_14_0_10_45_29]|nr:MAG: fructose-6-phosphate aldolase [Candidatus Micrarchaeota archaeon CG10_big_fil_rev_8_21_14_0_10_45_29]